MLKYLCFLFLLILPLNDETIEWHESLKLNWSNFQGEPNFETDAVAITASGISFGYSVQESNGRVTSFKAHVKAYFYPHKSWYKPEQVNDTTLMHERLHFDITEWHARLLRKQITALQPSQTVANTLDGLYAQMSQTLRQTQSQYDLESNHSINLEQQVLWQQKVATELKKLERFKE